MKWAFDYDSFGNITSIVDPKGYERRYHYDTLSRRRWIIDPNAGRVDLSYDDAGELVERRNALGERVTAEYGQQGRLLATRVWRAGASQPDRIYEFGYDAPSAGMPDAKNLRGQVAWASDPVSRTSWSYDEQGKAVATVREVWDPSRSSFDAQQRDAYRLDQALDPQGKLLSAQMPGGFGVSYGYNERNLVKGVTAGFAGELRSLVPLLNYNPQGGRVRADYANGTTGCTWFDARQRAVGRKVTVLSASVCVLAETDASAFQHLTYGYTVHGLIESIGDRTLVRAGAPRLDATYGYDRLYELTSAKTAEGTVSYRYDEIQNLISQGATQTDTGLPLGSFEYGGYGAGPNAVTSAGREMFGYDAAGRMWAYHGFDLVWDGQDRLLDAKRADGTAIQNFYAYAGERVLEIVKRPGVATEVHRYIFDGYQVHGTEQTWLVSAGGEKVAEISESLGLVPSLGQLDELVAYSLDPGRRPKPAAAELLDVNGDGHAVDTADLEVAARRHFGEAPAGQRVRVWRYYHKDHLGAPTHVSDSAGDWMSSTRFHAYGRVYGKSGDRPEYGYAGSLREPAEELGLLRMGARWFGPSEGHWITPDPLYLGDPRAVIDNPFGLAVYAYANNSPLNHIDPHGLEPNRSQAIDSDKMIGTIQRHFSGKEAELGKLKYSEGATGGGRQVGPFGGERGGRYIWTSKRGWIDLGHFFQVAAESKARIDSSIWPKWLAAGPARGRVNSALWDKTKEVEEGQRSTGQEETTWSYEDPSSNKAGLDFYLDYYTDDKHLSSALVAFFKDAGAGRPQSAPNWKLMQRSSTAKTGHGWFQKATSLDPILNPKPNEFNPLAKTKARR